MRRAVSGLDLFDGWIGEDFPTTDQLAILPHRLPRTFVPGEQIGPPQISLAIKAGERGFESPENPQAFCLRGDIVGKSPFGYQTGLSIGSRAANLCCRARGCEDAIGHSLANDVA